MQARLAALFIVLLTLASPCLATEGADVGVDRAKAARVKAAYLYHLVRLTEWPAGAFAAVDDSLHIAVVGDDDHDLVGLFRRTEHDLLAGRHPIAITHTSCDDLDPEAVHLVFYTDGVKDVEQRIARCREYPGLLLAGELPGFCEMGGMVGFAVDGRRVRIEANTEALEASGLRVSAEFLQHATMVKGGH